MKEMFYNAYLLPCLDYCCIKWSLCNKTEFEKVKKLQKRSAKILLCKLVKTPSSQLFVKSNWLTFENRYMYNTALLVFKSIQGLTPSYISDIIVFSKNETYTLRSTTNRNRIQVRSNTKYIKIMRCKYGIIYIYML
jgi:hypothetical protein